MPQAAVWAPAQKATPQTRTDRQPKRRDYDRSSHLDHAVPIKPAVSCATTATDPSQTSEHTCTVVHQRRRLCGADGLVLAARSPMLGKAQQRNGKVVFLTAACATYDISAPHVTGLGFFINLAG